MSKTKDIGKTHLLVAFERMFGLGIDIRLWRIRFWAGPFIFSISYYNEK